jgi:zinc transport system substrate-binding protein
MLAVGVAVVVLVAGACDRGGEDAAPAAPVTRHEKLTVYASVYPLADLARQIGGPYVTVEWLAESGQPLPGADVPSDVHTAVRSVDFVLSSGEPWAVTGYDDPIRAGRVLRLDVLPPATEFAQPHALTWLDPSVMRAAAEQLARQFAAKRTNFEPYFLGQAEALVAQLDAVVAQYEPVLRTQPPRRALVISPEFDRLLLRFAIEPVRPVDTTPSSITSGDVRRLQDAARRDGLTSVFVPADTPPALIDELQRKTDLTVLTLERLGTSAGHGRNTYVEMLKYNLDQLNQGASRPRG